MADLEDVTLDGRPLDSLRVTDLRAALEERGLAKSGQKSALMKRLKGALMLENLQKHSTPHTGYQPNSQMGEEMGQNSFIKQYLEKQQELLRQRLQREAREVAETEVHSADSEDEAAHTDIVPEPPDLLCSVLKMPEAEMTKRTPKKFQPVLDEPDDSEEDRPKKRERRSSRVKQTKVPQSPVFVEPAQEQEPRRSSTRVRKTKGDATPSKEPEEVGADEEEIEEDKEVKLVRDEGETPKRRRSARAITPQQQKKSPVVKRSPSPPELIETKAAALVVEEASEERVPPLLSFEGIKHQISTEKQVSSVSAKASPRKTHQSESSRAHRSPQKWGRQLREKVDEGSEQTVHQLSDSSLVIRQTASWHKEVENQKSNLQDLSKGSEKDGIAVNLIGGASSKEVKARSLVLMRPPVRAKSDSKTVSGEQSIHIIEKSSGRGVQAMSILEKKDPESPLLKDNVSNVSVCTEDVQSKQMPFADVDDTSETEKSQVISPSCPTGVSKFRKLKIRTSLGSNDQVDSNLAASAQELTIKNKKEKTAPQVYKKSPEVVTLRRTQGFSKLKKVKSVPCEELETTPQTTDSKLISPMEVPDLKKLDILGPDTVAMDSSDLIEKTGVSCVSVEEICEVKAPISIQSLPDHRTKEDIVSLDKLKEEQPSVVSVSPSEGQTFMEIQKTELKSEVKESSVILETQTLMSEKNRDVQQIAQLITSDHATPESVKESFLNMTSGDLLFMPLKEVRARDEMESTILDQSATVLQETHTAVLNVSAFESPYRDPATMKKDLKTSLVFREDPELFSLENKSLVTTQDSFFPVTGLMAAVQPELEDQPPVLDKESNEAALLIQITPELESHGNERLVVCEDPDVTAAVENIPTTAQTTEYSPSRDCVTVDISEDFVAINKTIETVASGDVFPVIRKTSITVAANEEQKCLSEKKEHFETLTSEENADAKKSTELTSTPCDVAEVGLIEEDSADLLKPSEVLVSAVAETRPELAHFTGSEKQTPSALQDISLVNEKMDITETVLKPSKETEEKNDVASNESSIMEGSESSTGLLEPPGPGVPKQTAVSEKEHIYPVDQKLNSPVLSHKDSQLEKTTICSTNLEEDSDMLDLEISADQQQSAEHGVSEERTTSAVEYITLISTDIHVSTPKEALRITEIGERSANLQAPAEILVSQSITENQMCFQVPETSATSNIQEGQKSDLTVTDKETLEFQKSKASCSDLPESAPLSVPEEMATSTVPNVSQVSEGQHIPVDAQKISEEKPEECSSDLREYSDLSDVVLSTGEHESTQCTVSEGRTTSDAQDISVINLEMDSQVSAHEGLEFNKMKEYSVDLKAHSELSMQTETGQQGPAELLVLEAKTSPALGDSPEVTSNTQLPEIEALEFSSVTESPLDVQKHDFLGPVLTTDQEEPDQLALSEEERAVSAIQGFTETNQMDISVPAQGILEFENAKKEHASDIAGDRSDGLPLSETSPGTVQEHTQAYEKPATPVALPEYMEFQTAEESHSTDVQEHSENPASEILTVNQPPESTISEETTTSAVHEHCELVKLQLILPLLSEKTCVDVQKPSAAENVPSDPEISEKKASVEETHNLDCKETTDISEHHDGTLRLETEQENLVTIACPARDLMFESVSPKKIHDGEYSVHSVAHDEENPIIGSATVTEEEGSSNVELLENVTIQTPREPEDLVGSITEIKRVCEDFGEISRSHDEKEAIVVHDHQRTHESFILTAPSTTVGSLPCGEQEVTRVEELQKEEQDMDDAVRVSPRRRSSSSSSTSSSASRSSSSSRSRRSSYSQSSSEKRKRKSRSSSSSSSSSSRSSSSHSDKVTSGRQTPPREDSVDIPTPITPPSLFTKLSPQLVASPPHPSQVVHLPQSTSSRWDSMSLSDRRERRRFHEDLKEPNEKDQAKRIRLEPKPEAQDHKSQVLEEEEVEQCHEDSNVVTESDDVVMEPVENQTEGEPQEAAPPQPSDDSCEVEDKKESTTTQRPFKRKISVLSATKSSAQPQPATTTNSDNEGVHPARRRRWGASTATTQKKPSISISTESLKSLIPEIKEIKQEAVVDLHAEDTHISEDEVERNGDDNSHDKGLKICRTVTQVVPAEVQENGQEPEEEEEAATAAAEEAAVVEPDSVPTETEVTPTSEQEVKKPPLESPARAEVRVVLGDTLLRRSISQQKAGVSITIDDPVRTASQQPSPPRRKVSCIVHICNLVRPFTLGQLKELLSRTGTLVHDHFWIDKIKSHCYATYSVVEEAVATRNSLHGVKWPQSNPKFLSVDFAEQDELDFHRGLLVERPPEPKTEETPHSHAPHTHVPTSRSEHREHERGVREQWAEREREMERRERTRSEREWDRDKIREGPRSRSRDRRRKEHAKSKEKKNEKKEKVQEEPPAKLLDDLFHKTKAVPCIYWLPLTDEQVLKKVADRAERVKEREKKRKEQEEQEEEERKERAKEREKEAERSRDRAREAEREKKREHSRERLRERERREPKRHSRSRSRSTPVRDRGGRR